MLWTNYRFIIYTVRKDAKEQDFPLFTSALEIFSCVLLKYFVILDFWT